MNMAQTLKKLNLPGETMVDLQYEDHEEVLHYLDNYQEDVLSGTYIASHLAALVAEFGPDVYYCGESILETLREGGYLEEYDDNETLEEYLEEVIGINHQDLGFIEFVTHKYDHKRGRCTVSVEVAVPLSCLLVAPLLPPGWKASVRTRQGVLMMG